MSPEHSPATATDATAQGDPTFWNALVDEKEAARFLGMTDRFMQHRRQQGDGPKFVAVSARCIRYRRLDLRAWSEARLRSSTSDHGAEA